MNVNFVLLIPEFLIAGLAFLVLAADLVLPEDKKSYLPFLGVAGLLGVIGSALGLIGHAGSIYGGVFLIDEYALFFKVFFPIRLANLCALRAVKDVMLGHLKIAILHEMLFNNILDILNIRVEINKPLFNFGSDVF